MSRDADLNTWNSSIFFSVFKTELDAFRRRPQRTELSDPTHPSLCAQTASSSWWLSRSTTKPGSLLTVEYFFSLNFSYNTKEKRHQNLDMFVFPAWNLTVLLNSCLQFWLPQHPSSLGIALLFSLSRICLIKLSNFFCQPGSTVEDNSAHCWRRNLKSCSGGESYILAKTYLSAHTSVTAQQDTLRIGLKDRLICCLFSHLPTERLLQCNVHLT